MRRQFRDNQLALQKAMAFRMRVADGVAMALESRTIRRRHHAENFRGEGLFVFVRNFHVGRVLYVLVIDRRHCSNVVEVGEAFSFDGSASTRGPDSLRSVMSHLLARFPLAVQGGNAHGRRRSAASFRKTSSTSAVACSLWLAVAAQVADRDLTDSRGSVPAQVEIPDILPPTVRNTLLTIDSSERPRKKER